MIRVMVVDDHDFVRSTMCELIDSTDDMRVVGAAENGAEALPTARASDPEVVLMDLSMPVMNGIDATRELVAAVPGIRVAVLVVHDRGCIHIRRQRVDRRLCRWKLSARRSHSESLQLHPGTRLCPARSRWRAG